MGCFVLFCFSVVYVALGAVVFVIFCFLLLRYMMTMVVCM